MILFFLNYFLLFFYDSRLLSNVGFCVFSLPSSVHLLVMLVDHKEEGHFQVFWRVLAHSPSLSVGPGPPTHSLYQSWLWQVAGKQSQPLSSGVSGATSCQGSRAPGGAPRLPCVCPSLSFSSFLCLGTFL